MEIKNAIIALTNRLSKQRPFVSFLENIMKYQFLPLNEDDLVECSHLYVNTFKHEPWNENWDMDDAFSRLSNFLSPSYSIGLKAVNDNKIQGFHVGEIEQWI